MSEGGYIQGAGDDSEGWAHGLTPPVFWANHAELKRTAEEDLPDVIGRLVGEFKADNVSADVTVIAPTRNLFIGEAGAGDRGFDLVIDCNGVPNVDDEGRGEGEGKRLNLGCASGKLGSRDLRKSLDKVREFVGARLGADSSLCLLVVCETGKDLSAGTLLAIICLFFNDDGMYAMVRRMVLRDSIQALHGRGINS
jgi:tRNA A64-2'-O-ribosylphosphate transferase